MEKWVETAIESQNVKIVNEKDDVLYQNLMKENDNFSFYLFDYAKPQKNFNKLRTQFPKISLWFDMSTNNEPTLLSELCEIGLNFNCFNYPEGKMIRDKSAKSKITISNSILNKNEVEKLSALNIDSIRVGSIEQVDLVKINLPNASIILDISTTRFGVNTAQGYEIIKECKAKNANLIGIFSNEKNSVNLSKMINFYNEIFTQEGFSLKQIFIEEAAMFENPIQINELANQYIINGIVHRSLINNYLTCFDYVIQEKFFEESKKIHYHVHNLEFINGRYFDDQESFVPSDRFIDKNEKKYFVSVYGPTCDGANYLVRDYPYAKLPPELKYIIIENIGCNSIIYGGSKFNGFDYSETTKLLRVYNKYNL